MYKLKSFRVFLNERLTVAAVEIFGAAEKTVVEYEEENDRLRRLLRITPEIKLYRIDLQLSLAVSEEEVPSEQQHCEQEWSPSQGQQDPEHTQIKEEQEELRTSQEEEQLKGLFDTKDSIFTPPYVKSELDQEEPLHKAILAEYPTLSRLKMSKLESFRVFLNERLKASAAVEIFRAFEKMIAEYLEENDRLRRLLRITPEIKLCRIDSLKLSLAVSEEEVPPEQQHCEQEWIASLQQEDPEPTQIKKEQEELGTNQEKEQLFDAEDSIFPPSCVKSECDQEDPLQCWTLPQTQTVENRESDTKSVDLTPFVTVTHIKDFKIPCDPPDYQNNASSHSSAENSDPVGLDSSPLLHPSPLLDPNLSMGEHYSKLGNMSRKTHRCRDCGKKFALKPDLQNHLTLAKKRLSECQFCKKRFNSTCELKTHVRLCQGGKPCTCPVCGKTFKETKFLSRHMRIHTGEKPFSCVDCGKSITLKQLTNVEILEIFVNSDNESEYETEESDSDSDCKELPPNLMGIENPESEDPLTTDKVSGPSEDAGGDGGTPTVGEVLEVCGSWKATSHFTPPGLAVGFDESQSGVKSPFSSPSAAECFKLFLTEKLMGDIVEETNRYALELLERREPGVRGKLAKWVTTTISEMYTFLVTVLLMGIVKKNSLREYWSTDPMFATPFFATLFSQDRFLVLLRCLHFVNNATANLNDPLHKIRNVLTSLTSAFGQVFMPYKDLCIDEYLMLWKGRLAFRQYIPSKRHRFGVKFFFLCDVKTGFVQDIIVYTGSTTDVQHYEGLGVSGSVVMTMLAPHLGRGHTLYVDNWYSSPTLFQHLFSNSTGACGTVQSNRKGMPSFGSRKMQRGEVEFKENGQQLAVKWHDKRDVHVLSTVHTATMSPTGKVDHLTGERKIKPDCVLDYNRKMGAVNKADMINRFVACAWKTTKWYKKIFFHLIDTAVLNGHIVHRQLSGEVITYQKYRENLMRELLEEHHTPRRPPTGGRPAADNPLRLNARHFPSKVPQTAAQGSRTRRHCKVCLSSTRRRKQRKLTKYMCVPCDIPLCVAPCFGEYHTLKHY
ncbi:piggyBac transposable element-derived protein 4 [Salvelinus sp. IW2-2015]|uniref:piggyBac transposable element-derived protein 4 n=1 Tax=Salvelinus sp. IW2-2015 TaxID=2691554 RepID=UPI000CEAA66F|nr:piggyBac transposable element-derived protein 4-like [Salvelinus alpinus]